MKDDDHTKSPTQDSSTVPTKELPNGQELQDHQKTCTTGPVQEMEWDSCTQEAVLVNACEQGDYETVHSLLIDKGVNPHCRSIHGLPLIHLSSNAGHTPIVELLLDLQADPNSCDSANFTPLHYSSYHGKLDVVQLLINRQGTVDAVGANGSSALHLAAAGDHHAVAQALIDYGAEVNRRNARNLRPTDLARSDAMKRLLDAGSRESLMILVNVQYFCTEINETITVPINISHRATVLELKSAIWKAVDIQVDEQQLVGSCKNRDKVLNDAARLCAIGVRDQDHVKLYRTNSLASQVLNLKESNRNLRQLNYSIQTQLQASLTRLQVVQKQVHSLEEQLNLHQIQQGELIQKHVEASLEKSEEHVTEKEVHQVEIENKSHSAIQILDKIQSQVQLMNVRIPLWKIEVLLLCALTIITILHMVTHIDGVENVQHSPQFKQIVTPLLKNSSRIDDITMSRLRERLNAFELSDTQQFTGPGESSSFNAIAVNHLGHVIAAVNHQIQVFTADGQLIRSFGAYGSGEYQFRFPTGVAVNRQGHIIVADTLNHRVQVFASEGKLIRSIFENESQPLFQYPRVVSTNRQDHIIVADAKQIQVFTSDGKYIRSIIRTNPTKRIKLEEDIGMEQSGRIELLTNNMISMAQVN